MILMYVFLGIDLGMEILRKLTKKTDNEVGTNIRTIKEHVEKIKKMFTNLSQTLVSI